MSHLEHVFFFPHIYFPASRQAVGTGVVPSSPRILPSFFIAHRVQQSHRSSSFHRVLLTHALAFPASQFVHKKKSQQIYISVHSARLELTNLTYTRLDDNLKRHRGDHVDLLDSKMNILLISCLNFNLCGRENQRHTFPPNNPCPSSRRASCQTHIPRHSFH